MVAKLIVSGETREVARRRAIRPCAVITCSACVPTSPSCFTCSSIRDSWTARSTPASSIAKARSARRIPTALPPAALEAASGSSRGPSHRSPRASPRASVPAPDPFTSLTGWRGWTITGDRARACTPVVDWEKRWSVAVAGAARSALGLGGRHRRGDGRQRSRALPRRSAPATEDASEGGRHDGADAGDRGEAAGRGGQSVKARHRAGARSDEDGTAHPRVGGRPHEGGALRAGRAGAARCRAGGPGVADAPSPRVTIVEVGPRDGLQNEAASVPTATRLPSSIGCRPPDTR